MQIVGLDLSLNATGVAYCNARAIFSVTTKTLKPPTGCQTGLPRLEWIRAQAKDLTATAGLVVIEGLSFASRGMGQLERAGLAYLIYHMLWMQRRPYFLVTPSQLKKFVTGRGNAEKSLMLREVWRRWKIDAGDDNQADAAGLVQIGRALIGELDDLTLTKPQQQVIADLRKANAEVVERINRHDQ